MQDGDGTRQGSNTLEHHCIDYGDYYFILDFIEHILQSVGKPLEFINVEPLHQDDKPGNGIRFDIAWDGVVLP